ncbi:MAG: cell division topological specificity factor MinE [Legionellales bacterium]|nr:cell division topological specificity factor MinE [Legionellales bacterium]
MSILNYFRKQKPSANIAKERLQIIISHERSARQQPDFLPRLQQDIVEVIAKYIAIDQDQVNVQLEHIGDNAILELNITMPEIALESSADD